MQTLKVIGTVIAVAAVAAAFLGIFALGLRDCGKVADAQRAADAKARSDFMGQCRADGKTATDCEVLWAQVSR